MLYCHSLIKEFPPSFQLEDGHSIFDYDVGLNDIIQLMVRPLLLHTSDITCQNGNGITHNGMENGTSGSSSSSEVEEVMETVSSVSVPVYCTTSWVLGNMLTFLSQFWSC